jgi:hypothetical protein
MNTNKKTAEMKDRKVILSTLWIFVMFNILYADILSFMDSRFLKELMTGYAGDIQITQGFLVVAAILLEIPIAMIFLSRVLKSRVNRWANIIAGAITLAFVIGGGSTAPHYLFLATIEVVCLLLIVWYAWTWPKLEEGERK